jgi:hypothetical protein
MAINRKKKEDGSTAPTCLSEKLELKHQCSNCKTLVPGKKFRPKHSKCTNTNVIINNAEVNTASPIAEKKSKRNREKDSTPSPRLRSKRVNTSMTPINFVKNVIGKLKWRSSTPATEESKTSIRTANDADIAAERGENLSVNLFSSPKASTSSSERITMLHSFKEMLRSPLSRKKGSAYHVSPPMTIENCHIGQVEALQNIFNSPERTAAVDPLTLDAVNGRSFSGEVEPLPSNPPQTRDTERNLEEPFQEEIRIDSAIETIWNKVQEGGTDSRIRGLAVAIFNHVQNEQNKATVISMKYKLPGKSEANQSFAKITKAVRLKGKTKEWGTPKVKANWISTRVSLLQAILDESCNIEDIVLQKDVVAALARSMIGKVIWTSKTSMLDVTDCMVLQSDHTLSTNNIQSILLSAEKLMDNMIKICPTRLKMKIGQMERTRFAKCFHKLVTCSIGDESAECVFYYIKNLPFLFESMVSSPIAEGTFEESILFSNFVKTMIFGRGIDRGGSDIMDMWRLVNQIRGNDGKKVVPGGVVEDASETYDNLKKTVLGPERNKMTHLLEEEKIFVLTFDLRDEESRKSFDARAAMVQFEGPNDNSFDNKTLKVRPILLPGYLDLAGSSQEEEFEERAVFARDTDRELPCTIKLIDSMIVNGESNLPIRLVRIVHPETDHGDKECHEIVGFEVLSPTNYADVLYTFRFAFPIAHESSKLQKSSIIATCYNSMVIYSDDGKMINMVAGLGTNSCTYNCPKCLKRCDCQAISTFVKEFGVQFPDDVVFEDYQLREGDEYSYDALYSQAKARMGGNNEYTLTKSKNTHGNIEATKSVLSEPIRRTDIHSVHGDALHLHEGMASHLTRATLHLLAEAVSDVEIPYSIDAMTEEALKFSEEVFKLKESAAFKKSEVKFKETRKMVDGANRSLKKIVDKDSPEANECLNSLKASKIQLHTWARTSGHSQMIKKIKGASKFLSMIKGKKTKEKIANLRGLTQTEYLFTKSIRNEAGKFNKQHGGLELTGRRNMLMLEDEARKRIKEIVSESYKEDETINAKVRFIMEWWETSGYHLYRLGERMKDQQKVTPDKLHEMKFEFAHYLGLWYNMVTWKNPLYWKLHVVMCCFIPFAEKTGMGGRVAAEGFENKHFVARHQKELLDSIPQTGLRVQKLNERNQVFLCPGFAEKKKKIISNSIRLGKKPNGYKTKGLKTKHNEEIEQYQEAELVPDGEGFIDIDDILIHEKVIDMYLFYMRGKVPGQFAKPIEDREDFGTKVKSESMYKKNN